MVSDSNATLSKVYLYVIKCKMRAKHNTKDLPQAYESHVRIVFTRQIAL